MEQDRSWDMLSRACLCHTLKLLCHKGVLQHEQLSTAQHSKALQDLATAYSNARHNSLLPQHSTRQHTLLFVVI